MRKTTPKAVAAELGVSLSLVYKWAEKPVDDSSGSRNPLDRLLQIIKLSEDNGIVDWLCQKQGGHFVKDPDVSGHQIDHVLPATQEIIGQFSDLLGEVSHRLSPLTQFAESAGGLFGFRVPGMRPSSSTTSSRPVEPTAHRTSEAPTDRDGTATTTSGRKPPAKTSAAKISTAKISTAKTSAAKTSPAKRSATKRTATKKSPGS